MYFGVSIRKGKRSTASRERCWPVDPNWVFSGSGKTSVIYTGRIFIEEDPSVCRSRGDKVGKLAETPIDLVARVPMRPVEPWPVDRLIGLCQSPGRILRKRAYILAHGNRASGPGICDAVDLRHVFSCLPLVERTLVDLDILVRIRGQEVQLGILQDINIGFVGGARGNVSGTPIRSGVLLPSSGLGGSRSLRSAAYWCMASTNWRLRLIT